MGGEGCAARVCVSDVSTGAASAPHSPAPAQVDTANHLLRRVNVSSGAVTTLAGSPTQSSGHADGVGTAASFYYPYFVALDSAGAVAIVVSVCCEGCERRGAVAWLRSEGASAGGVMAE